MNRNKFNSVLYLTLFILISFSSYLHTIDVTINWDDLRQEIDGFGGGSGRPHSPATLMPLIHRLSSEADRQRILDFIFLQSDGCLGVSLVRQPIPDWLMPSPGVWDWTAVEDQVWYINEAKKRNPDVVFWASPWSPPGWMKYSGKAEGSGTTAEDSMLREDMYQEFADYLSTYSTGFKSRYGIDIYAVSFQNEPTLFVTYEVCIWNYDNKIVDFVKNYLKPAFERDNVTTKFAAADHCWWNNSGAGATTILNILLNDPVCRDFVDIGAAHQYWNLETAPLDQCKEYNKRQWQTEISQIGDDPDEYKNSILMARYIHENMTHAESNSWQYYTLWDPNDGRWALINSTTELPKRAYALGHFSRFIRPGYYRVGMSGSGTQRGEDPSGVYVSAYKDTTTGKFVIVAINDNTTQQDLNITFNGCSVDSPVTPYVTSRTQNMEHISDISVSNNMVSITLAPETMVTYTGTAEESLDSPSVSVSVTTLDFGNVDIGKTGTLDFTITNTGGGLLSGSISTDRAWIQVTPTSFTVDPLVESNSVIVNVTVDNNILNQPEGKYTGTITITSNGGNASVEVTLVATCVLVKPNPYNPASGPLIFFGDGIVPGNTTIKIYTLSGELVAVIPRCYIGGSNSINGFPLTTCGNDTLQWNGKNENGEEVTSGIYIYVYESPKEKGVGKFTVIRK